MQMAVVMCVHIEKVKALIIQMSRCIGLDVHFWLKFEKCIYMKEVSLQIQL